MRETLRGTLLSVLFFALLIGSAPTMAAADYPQSTTSAAQIKERHGPCQTPGYINTSSGCMSPEEMNHHNNCDIYGDAAILGGAGTIVSSAAVLLPEPISSFFGAVGLAVFGPTAIIGAGLYVWNDC
ncbi:MAG: hypothetical protein OXU63_00675 [Acidobacteriota bacterium]|nr:hypothetical protein [Acidobacteriota bacterium]